MERKSNTSDQGCGEQVIANQDLQVAIKANPDLPESFILELLAADTERKQGLMKEYVFG